MAPVSLRRLVFINEATEMQVPVQLHGNASHLLACLCMQASKIKGFLKQQKTRSDTATAKTEWLLTAQQLQEER
jgi:hypothetical protein